MSCDGYGGLDRPAEDLFFTDRDRGDAWTEPSVQRGRYRNSVLTLSREPWRVLSLVGVAVAEMLVAENYTVISSSFPTVGEPTAFLFCIRLLSPLGYDERQRLLPAFQVVSV